MSNFNLKQAAIYRAVCWERNFIFKFIKNSIKPLLVLFAIAFILFLYGFIKATFNEEDLTTLLGLSTIFLVLGLIFQLKQSFLNSKLKKPRLRVDLKDVSPNSRKFNLAEFLSFESAKAISKSKENSTILFYNLIADNENLKFIFSRSLLNIKEIKKLLRKQIKEMKPSKKANSKIFQDIITESLKVAQRKKNKLIEAGDLLTALSKYDPVFKQILMDIDMRADDIENLSWWLESLELRIAKSKKFWELENLLRKGSIARDLAAGYTITLDQFSTDWNEVVKQRGFEEIIGIEEEVVNMETVLSQEGVHSVLLIGEPGTGRKSAIHNLAQRVFFGQSVSEINYKRIVSLDIVSILAHSKSLGEAEITLEKVFNEAASAGNVILVIDEFYSFVSQPTGRAGTIDISAILLRYLSVPSFKVIGITSFLGLHLFVEKNPSILKFMATVKLKELTEQETIRVLENKALAFEQKYKRFISYPALRDIVKNSSRYIHDFPFPKKALDLLEETVTYVVRYTKGKVVLPEHVSKVVSKKTDIPVGELEQKEKDILLNLEDLIHERIINQEEAVKEVSSSLRRARAEVTVRKGPMGCFLFLGSTGVGKTETSKALAEIYFGAENRMIRLDMSEFQSLNDIPRLIGSAVEEGLLTTSIKEKPFSLILLDEIEKAHPNILNLFLQVLDEGFLTDGLGRKVDFKNSIIIATSNAGADLIWEDIKRNKQLDAVKDDLLSYFFKKAIFRPEFINRFDSVVVFRPLSKENLIAIAELMLQRLKSNLKEKEIEFIITQPLKRKIAELGYDPTFGARELRRVIQDKIENVLANALLSGKLKKGKKVEVDSIDFSLKIT